MIRKWFKLKTKDITLVQFIIEGYEGMATVSTIDPQEAILQLLIIPDYMDDLEVLLVHLKDQFAMEEVPFDHSRVSSC